MAAVRFHYVGGHQNIKLQTANIYIYTEKETNAYYINAGIRKN